MGNAATHIYRYLSDDGTSTGTKEVLGNYSGAVQRFYYTATGPDNINRMLVSIVDTNGMLEDEYGNLGVALTNGISVCVWNSDFSSVILDLTDGEPIKTNGNWIQVCYDATLTDLGPGNDYFGARWTFGNSGQIITLDKGQHLGIEVNDDLTGLIQHRFMLQGYK